ncbi:MAG: hypothetical protein PHN18_10620 [Sulfurospirillaceae bacterium]|nr:hypothetical protein [Sulfurospirillaceae bacterium]MDD2827406.1 hypothetical protein [Sulfurospirillaceae bacterium]
MIYSVINNKGGCGKTTFSFHALTAILGDFTLLEIDNSNNSARVYSNSATLKRNIVKSVKLEDGEAAFDEAMFSLLAEDSGNIIVDTGGGDDTYRVTQLLLESTNYDECVFIIPLFSNRAQLQNALDTYELVKDRKVIFVLNGANNKEDFVFWYGSSEYDLPSVDPKILNLPTFFLPKTHLFDLAALSSEVLMDSAQMASMYSSTREAQEDIAKIAAGDFTEYRRILGRYRISVQAKNYIEENFKNFKTVLKTI